MITTTEANEYVNVTKTIPDTKLIAECYGIDDAGELTTKIDKIVATPWTSVFTPRYDQRFSPPIKGSLTIEYNDTVQDRPSDVQE